MQIKVPASQSKTFKALVGPALIIIAALLWSLDGVLRSDLRTIPPSFLVFLEHTLGFLPLIPFLYIYRKEFFKASTKAKLSLITTSIISGVLGTYFYTRALGEIQYVPFSVVVLMQQLQPLVVVSLAAAILKEKIDYRFVVAGIFALIGAYLLSFPDLLPDLKTVPGKSQAIAAGFALAAAASWGSGTIFSKNALKELNFQAATAGRYLITIPTALILALILGQTMPLADITNEQWMKLGLIVISAGTVALLIYYKGLARTEARISTFAELTWPVSAFVIDLIRGFSFTESQLIGAVILLIMISRIAAMQKFAADVIPSKKRKVK